MGAKAIALERDSFLHLNPEVRHAACLSDAERLALVGNVSPWIQHTMVQENITKILMAMNHPPSTSMPNYMLIAPSGNGKTSLLLKVVEKFPPRQVGKTTMHDVVFQNMPGVPSPSSFLRALLEAIGAPWAHNARVDELGWNVKRTFTKVGVKLILIDEFQNLAAATNIQHRLGILNNLKDLSNVLKVPIVIAGTGDVYHVIKNDKQMLRRFQLMELRLWYDADDLPELLVSFAEIFPLRLRSDLSTERISDLVLKRTDGTIGGILKLLKAAAEEAIKTGTERITFELLSKVRFLSPSEEQGRIRRVI